MALAKFHQQMIELTGEIADRDIDERLETWFNAEYGANSDVYVQFKQSCLQGCELGWLCDREAGGIRYGRVFKPDDALNRFSWMLWICKILLGRIMRIRRVRLI